ncbi:MAG: hypothetical protein ACI9BW_000907 [Gammaproteobacteria bacterium]|jgi:hypothetical protein
MTPFTEIPLINIRRAIGAAILTCVSLHVHALEFDFGTPVGFTQPALDALSRAALQWTSRIDDPITVNIETNFLDFDNSNTIASAFSVTLISGLTFSDTVINQLKIDAAAEGDDSIVASLPSVGDLHFDLPTNIDFLGDLAGTKANFKALALPGFDLDTLFGSRDGLINFNLDFNFDFDNSNGVTPGHMDFETVAAHELGHALGFISAADDVDFLLSQGRAGTIAPTLLDLFRFAPGADDPLNTTDFATATRNLTPGDAAFFDDLDNEYLFSTGVFTGDGRQASHWKDTDSIGILDPTLAFGQVFTVSAADLRALDVIGYDITAVPLPPAIILFASAFAFLGRRHFRLH